MSSNVQNSVLIIKNSSIYFGAEPVILMGILPPSHKLFMETEIQFLSGSIEDAK